MDMDFDYVVVGAEAGGAVLAARLSEDPAVRVCVIRDREAGQGGHARRSAAEGVGRALPYLRGHPSDFDDWARAGCDGWSFEDVLRWFRRAEGNARGETALHGARGPMQVADSAPAPLVADAFVQAALAHGLVRNPDFNGPHQDGVGFYQRAQFHDGLRAGEPCTAAAAYLQPALQRPNLTLLAPAQIVGLAFDGRRVVGLEVRGPPDGRVTVRAHREVALCGGALRSPQWLMLSGVGDPNALAHLGIALRHALPQVGRNLQDPPEATLAYAPPDAARFAGLSGVWDRAKAALPWWRGGHAPAVLPVAEAGAFLRSGSELLRPDLQLEICIAAGEVDGFSARVRLLRPRSRGTVGLRSSDPASLPQVQVQAQRLGDPHDAVVLREGLRRLRAILGAPALLPFGTAAA